MSWNAYCLVPVGEVIEVDGVSTRGVGYMTAGDWNYTHNCNGMIREALTYLRVEEIPEPGVGLRVVDGELVEMPRVAPWWRYLERDGTPLLENIVGVLAEAPEHFREQNPENGWGDYDSLMKVLVEMRDLGRRYPDAIWMVNG